MSNLRPAPMFLRPSVVRQLINDTREIRKGLAQLPLVPLPLVDQPMPSASPESEIVKFDTEHGPALNDDEPNPVEADATGRDSEPAAELSEPAAESEPVQSPFTCNGAALDWPDAPLPEHADPDLDRPEPTPADDAGEISARPKKKSVRSRLPVKESGLDRMAARESVSPTQRAMATAEKRSPILPLSIEERRRRLDLAIAHLKRQCILVDIVDRSAPIRTYRVSGKRESKLAEEVIKIAVARGLELDQ